MCDTRNICIVGEHLGSVTDHVICTETSSPIFFDFTFATSSPGGQFEGAELLENTKLSLDLLITYNKVALHAPEALASTKNELFFFFMEFFSKKLMAK